MIFFVYVCISIISRTFRIPFHLYIGDRDYTCNWKGNEAWTKALEWSGQNEFANKPLREWEVDGKRAGKVRSSSGTTGSAGKFTFVTVEGAGHMVSSFVLGFGLSTRERRCITTITVLSILSQLKNSRRLRINSRNSLFAMSRDSGLTPSYTGSV
jgi:hypothetical protein